MEHLLNQSNKDMVKNYFQMEISIKVNINPINFMEMANIFGQTALFMMVLSIVENERVLVHGDQVNNHQIFTMDNTNQIRNQVKGNTFGIMESNTMDIFLTI